MNPQFYWGAATASYQVEGGIENNDWSEAARQGKVPAAGRATDHYNRFEEDFSLARQLGHNAHRFSIEWSRIEPEEGVFDESAVSHYATVFDSLRAHGLEPFVTLWHFTLPLWFSQQGGFEHPQAPEKFARYCEYVLKNLGSKATYWITINEPMVYASIGYRVGFWPPFQKNLLKFERVTKALIQAHKLAYERMKTIVPRAQISIAKNNIHFAPSWHPLALFMRWFWNHRFLRSISRHQDFIGLNYYFHHQFGFRQQLPKSDMGWEIYPEGLYHVLMELKRYHKPVYILENGIADTVDTQRAQFITDHIEQVRRAQRDDLEVKGYFYWSLLDNFEWAYGFKPRFGLVAINYATLERTVRPSALVYQKLIQSSGILK